MQLNSINGDAAIGRHLSVGGDASIRGSARVGHGLKVDGWLDAPNVIGPCKGLFASASDLAEAYPLPAEGWWAYVGTGLPADIYAVAGGRWEPTGEQGGVGEIDLRIFEGEIEALQQADNRLASETAECRQRISELENASVDTSDVPEQGGRDAFSTGGAFEAIITDFEESLSDDGEYRYYQAVNANGAPIGDRLVVPLHGGSGGGSGSGEATVFAIAFEQSPVYAAVGARIVARMAARSYTRIDGAFIQNNIARIAVLDAATGSPLRSTPLENEPSSSAMDDFKFEVDLTEFFSGAGKRSFTVQATDQEGNVRSKQVSAVAVDLSVVSPIPLADCRVAAGSGIVSLPAFYQFPSNASPQGIEASVDILWEGEWRPLGRETVAKTFPADLQLNPSDLFGGGERLGHGSCLVRIQGWDPVAKVRGNPLYTSIMCLDPSQAAQPLAAIRLPNPAEADASGWPVVPLGSSIEVEAYAYAAGAREGEVRAAVLAGGAEVASFAASAIAAHRLDVPVRGVAPGALVPICVRAEHGSRSCLSPEACAVAGELPFSISPKPGESLSFDFSARSNGDSALSIVDSASGIPMVLADANYSSNGFGEFLGRRCLAAKEGVRATVAYRPFGAEGAERAGLALQFSFATDNVRDPEAVLFSCCDPASGAGFEVRGNSIAVRCAKGAPSAVEERRFPCRTAITAAVVVESASQAVERAGSRFSFVKLYLDGELVAAVGYPVGQSAVGHQAQLSIDGSDADFYLYSLKAWLSQMLWQQASHTAIASLPDYSSMAAEVARESVVGASGEPELAALLDAGIPCYVVVAPSEMQDAFDSGTSTSENFSCTLVYRNPQHPCLSFRAEGVRWRRQGTTSAKRPVKNDRFYLDRASSVELLSPDPSTELGRLAIAMAPLKRVVVAPGGVPVQRITAKVDFSDSSGANDSAVCDMMNATFRALGGAYLTPAQRACTGEFSFSGVAVPGRSLDHSTKNHPVAAFRASDDGLADARFYAKANWKEDKGEQLALGFRDTPGYNLGCVNYGEFTEVFALPGESLDAAEARFLASPPDSDALFLLSPYCGRDYRFLQRRGGEWQRLAGSMRFEGGRWVVEGTVLNPVIGFELLAYQGMCWWEGVSSVDDMMAPSSATSSWVQKLVDAGLVSAQQFPAWTQYFECMVDDDQLAVDFALGRKVPYDLYRFLRFCSEAAPGTPEGRELWRTGLCRHASVASVLAYSVFTDYLAAVDQRAKNMQPMWFLEEGESVVDGCYSSASALRMYLNKVYDCDTCCGADNDGGCSVDPEVDPDMQEAGNPYAGYGSLLFRSVAEVGEALAEPGGQPLSLQTVAAAMRSAVAQLPDGSSVRPFSPEGAMRFFVADRLSLWPKAVSTVDGMQKYLLSAPRADALYFYALHGLGLLSLPRFLEMRWRVRDGYYRTGQFFSGVLSGRIACAPDARIGVVAARRGWFGIGHDASGQLDEAVFLDAGEAHEFTLFSHTEGALVYMYQADRLREIDLSEVSLDSGFDFSVMALAERIDLSKEAGAELPIGAYAPLSSLPLGSLPFLRELVLAGSSIQSVDASQCPRLERLDASGSALRFASLPKAAPLSHLALPASVAELRLLSLPALSYPGGLSLAAAAAPSRLWVEGCPGVDSLALASLCASRGSLVAVRLPGVSGLGDPSALDALRLAGVGGMDASGADIASDRGPGGVPLRCSSVMGSWEMSTYPETLPALQAYFPGVEFDCGSFSAYAYDPAADSPDVQPASPQGVFEDIRSQMVPLVGSLDGDAWLGRRLSASDYSIYADGSPVGEPGPDDNFMMRVPGFWYKGVALGGRCLFFASLEEEPPQGICPQAPWTRSDEFLIGIYQGSLDGSGRVRSLPGAVPMRGVLSPSAARTACRSNGSGYRAVDYAMHRLLAHLWYALASTRDVQAVCGQGLADLSAPTGFSDSLGCADSSLSTSAVGVKCLGLESFFGSGWELMERIVYGATSISVTDSPSAAPGAGRIADKLLVCDTVLSSDQRQLAKPPVGPIGEVAHGAKADLMPSAAADSTDVKFADECVADFSELTWMFGCRGGLPASSGAGLAAIAFIRHDETANLTARLAYRGEIIMNN